MMQRLNLKNFDQFPINDQNIIINHYDDFNMHKDIIDRIGQLEYSLTPSKLTYATDIALHKNEKRNVRFSEFMEEDTFIYYFPLILDRIHEQYPNGPEKKRPLIVFVTQSPESALKAYSMIEEFTKTLDIKIALSHQCRKMEMNLRSMRSPFHILVITIANLLHHVTKGIMRFGDLMYLVLFNLHEWNGTVNYIDLTNEMIKCGWDPKNKCSIIATSSELNEVTKNIYSDFSFRKHYDLTPSSKN